MGAHGVDRIQKTALRRHTNFHFMTPTASSHCGVWEIPVKTVKQALKSALTTNLVSEQVLRATLTTIERIVNSHPITPIGDDTRDLEVRTPNHLLLKHRAYCTPQSIVSDADIHRSSWKQIQYLSNVYWKRWLKLYLTSLQGLSKWRRTTRDTRVGDLVLINEDNLPRGRWPLGRIVEIHPGTDWARAQYYRRPTVATRATTLSRSASYSDSHDNTVWSFNLELNSVVPSLRWPTSLHMHT